MAIHNIIGKKGEDIACSYITERGYKIIARNWRFRKTEIDIIAMDGEFMVVLEVKTRTSKFVENLSEIVNPKKQKALVNAANAYIDINSMANEVRFDIVFIVMHDELYSLEHCKNAFTAVGWRFSRVSWVIHFW